MAELLFGQWEAHPQSEVPEVTVETTSVLCQHQLPMWAVLPAAILSAEQVVTELEECLAWSGTSLQWCLMDFPTGSQSAVPEMNWPAGIPPWKEIPWEEIVLHVGFLLAVCASTRLQDDNKN